MDQVRLGGRLRKVCFSPHAWIAVLVIVCVGVWLISRKPEETTHTPPTHTEQTDNSATISAAAAAQATPRDAEPEGNETEQPLPHIPLPSSLEEVELSPYRQGTLVYAVDGYIKEEADLVRQIQQETFGETLFRMSDWNNNYYKMVTRDADPLPSIPSSLELILLSRRYAKLVEHGRAGMTEEEIEGIRNLLASDLERWKRLREQGQALRAPETILHSVNKESDELIVPLTFRINATILLVGELALEPVLSEVVEAVNTFGEDTNWAAAAYACDRVLTSLDAMKLSVEQRRVVDEYRAWRETFDPQILEYEKMEIPSYDSLRRPGDRAVALKAEVDFSTGRIIIHCPPQYTYLTLSGGGYFDPTRANETLKKIVGFAESYLEAKR